MDPIAELPGEPLRAVTDEEVAAFARDGVVHLPGMLPLSWIEALEAPLDRVVSSGEAVDVGSIAGESADAPVFAAGVDHWRHDPTFEAFALASPLAPVVAALMGSDRVWLWEDSVLVKEPHSPFETRAHTDAAYFPLEGTRICTTWIPLDPVSADSGALWWVRGSHLDPVEYRPNLFVVDDPIPGTTGEPFPDVQSDPELSERVVTFEVHPGDLTVHHARTLHGAPPNTSDRRRRAVSVRFCGEGVTHRSRPGLALRPEFGEVSDGEAVGERWCPAVWPR